MDLFSEGNSIRSKVQKWLKIFQIIQNLNNRRCFQQAEI
jgi:hypothetical protein